MPYYLHFGEGVCIMMHDMDKICILLEEKYNTESFSDAKAAVRAFRALGFDTELRVVGEQVQASAQAQEPAATQEQVQAPASTQHPSAYGTLYIADSGRLLRELSACGAAFCAYAHDGNAAEDLSAAEYVLMDLPWVDRDSLEKIWQRQRNLPWKILETERCTVREFVPDDLEAVYALYDAEARRFLEPPSEDRVREGDILAAYIQRVYRLCGYGHWAVLLRETGELVGRMGFSFPAKSWPGPAPGATFGYLVRSDWRGQGITREVGAAILKYGFEQLGFETIGADASVLNTISDKILRNFSFVPVAEEQNQRYYILHNKNWRNNP